MELPLSKQGKINGERRVFQDKCTDQGSPDQYFFIARKSNVFSLLGNGGSHEGKWNGTIYLSTDISSRHGSSREWMKCRTSHWLRVSHCMSAAANPLDIFPFAAKPQVPNWLEIGPTADGGHVDLTLVVATSALNANDVCLLFLLHYTCHVSITHKYAPKIPHLFDPSFTCVTLSGPRLRLRFAIWPATSKSCTRLLYMYRSNLRRSDYSK